jgi:hypothetical protein
MTTTTDTKFAVRCHRVTKRVPLVTSVGWMCELRAPQV